MVQTPPTDQDLPDVELPVRDQSKSIIGKERTAEMYLQIHTFVCTTLNYRTHTIDNYFQSWG